jgi:mono/diheme cytochrome c family protein
MTRELRLLGSIIPFASCLVLLASSSSLAAESVDPPVSANYLHFDEDSGAKLYAGVCQACHMDQGQGASGAGAFPALKANPRLAAAAYPIYNILHGKGGMPPVGVMMTDAQVADVVNYLRSHFDNHYSDMVSPEDVKRLR